MPKLTKSIVDRAELKDRQYTIWCSDLKGFGVYIYPTGKRTYFVDYRAEAGRRRMTIGSHGAITTDQARKLAIETMGGVVLQRDDPLLERKTRRKSLTVAQLCDQYITTAQQGLILGKGGRPKKASTLATDLGRIERHIKPLLGRKLVIDLRQADVTRFVRDVTAGKTAAVEKTGRLRGKAVVEGGAGTASRTTGLLGGILSYAVGEGIIESNPARGVKRPADNKKERRLSAAEYRELGKALEAAEGELWQVRAGIWLLALTGCRISEIARLRWSEVDLGNQVLRLGDTKTGASIRPLGNAAVSYFERLPKAEGSSWVLPGARSADGHFGGLPGAIERMAAKAKVEGLTAHVLRHSFASIAGDLDYSEATIGTIIGHAGHTITSRYVHRLDTVLIAAANRISAEVERQMTGRSANVVQLPRSA
ncbi:tyrosine-type recombinase/integrase [Devosia sp. RR2S18]|uniref:tyrosine-type recombinase/integrase n=1 Tax=Devosia rhizosphaerae TaxID=3049774 RepID=UPI0025410052|nr:site-specific integrase [Devosia sp. RR2S18]WIJ24983.1 tyrosine-type recombinase/integrase [Devosia sp. RR2S18]